MELRVWLPLISRICDVVWSSWKTGVTMRLMIANLYLQLGTYLEHRAYGPYLHRVPSPGCDYHPGSAVRDTKEVTIPETRVLVSADCFGRRCGRVFLGL